MLTNILIKVYKRKLEYMILHTAPYKKILKQSQKLDVFVNKKFVKINNMVLNKI